MAGDIITIASDTNNYVVNSALASNVLSIGAPGLISAGADNAALTVGNSYTPNVAFHKSAIELGIRPPALPAGGDSAVDIMTVQDPYSGLVFEIAVYKGYMKTMLEVRCLYGVKVWKPNNVAIVMG